MVDQKLGWNWAIELEATLSLEAPSSELTSDNIFLSFVEIKLWRETLWRKFLAKYRAEYNLVLENKKFVFNSFYTENGFQKAYAN